LLSILAGHYVALAQNPPVAAFTANVTSGCAPLLVTFTDQSSGSPTTWNWELSNGTLSNIQNPVISFSTPGTYSVKLVAINADGISQVEKTDYITVFPSPTANFSSDLNLACVPATINFTDLSNTATGTITNWDWDFGDGGTSTVQSPSHTYSTIGFYAVTLKITSNTGCTNVISRGNYIRIVGGVTTDFSYSQPTTCRGPFPTNFQNESNGPGNVSYTWDFGNGQTSTLQNPFAVFNTAGTYLVKLNAQSDLGCSGSIEKTITIDGTTTDFTAPVNACLNTPVNFQNVTSGMVLQSTWDFGDGTTSAQINPVKTYLVPGTYNVKLINRYSNCTDSANKSITIADKPAPDFSANDSAFCKVPFDVQFTDLTVGASSWLWDFGDGTTSTLQNPSHQYTTTGNFTVSLTVTTAISCTNTIVKTDFIKIQPISVFVSNPPGGCIPFIYTPASVITSSDPIASYLWDFGDGSAPSTMQVPPNHQYNTLGNYTISLTVTTTNGCSQTGSTTVRVGPPLIPDFSGAPTDVCAKDKIQFTNLTVVPPPIPGVLVEWLWDFGDGTTSVDENPEHYFLDTGMLNVSLVVLYNKCGSSVVTKQFHIQPPIAGFKYTVSCAPIANLVTFIDTSKVNAFYPATYDWLFPGATSITSFSGQNPPPVQYPGGPGDYPVTLTVTNGPCSYTSTQMVRLVREAAGFTVTKPSFCKNELVRISATANPANVQTYAWTVDGAAAGGSTATLDLSYSTVGTHDVQLTITDINGCVIVSPVSVAFVKITGPLAGFAPATPGACLNKSVTFNDLSTPAGTIAKWDFDFGDGTTQAFTAAPFTHVYGQGGAYPVSLTVTDNAGCTDSYSLPADLFVTDPKAGFAADTFYCPNSALPFRDSSSGAGLTYLWNFGDGNTSTLQNPTNSFPNGDALYTVKLVVTDISGCKDSVTKLNYINIKSPKAAFDIQDTTTICPPLRTSFFFKGKDHARFYWDFGDGGTSYIPDPTYFYSSYGTFTPKLYVLGNGGCIDSAQSSVTIHDPSTSHINYGPVTTACNSLSVDFNLVIPAGFKFYFYFGDGGVDSSQQISFTHLYGSPGFNYPYLIIYDTLLGCQAYISGPTRIDVLGALPLFGMDKSEFCDNGTVQFTDFTVKNEPIISTVWDFGDGATSGDQSPTHSFTQPGTYLVNLNITTQSNCSKTYTDTVLVYRTPVPTITGRDTICVNVAELYTGSIAVADTLTKWNWDFANGQTSTSQNASGTYSQPGDYAIKLVTSNEIGCSNTFTKNIYVAPLPTAVATQDPVTIISGGGTYMPMVYTGAITSYNWSPTYRLDCVDCPVPYATPKVTTKYTVSLEDRYGCRSSGDVTIVVVCNNQNFFIPNTFSPNGDGKNETFYPRGTGLFRIKSMMVFNRWGQTVFSRKDFLANDPAQGWNGTFQGQPVSPDVYIYMIEILCDNNTVIPVKGNVTLLR